MGFRFNKRIGPKGFKVNIGKRGISSASIKIAPGITYNTKRGTTLGIPGTGLSYNTGGSKYRNQAQASQVKQFSLFWFIFWLIIFFPAAIIYWIVRK